MKPTEDTPVPTMPPSPAPGNEPSRRPPAPAPVPRPVGGSKEEAVKVAKIKVTSAGPSSHVEFKGKTYDRDGTVLSSPSEEDLAAMDASPLLVVERFDKDGHLLNKFGKHVKTLGPNPPPSAPRSEEPLPHSDDEKDKER